jgi:hypothetical protein
MLLMTRSGIISTAFAMRYKYYKRYISIYTEKLFSNPKSAQTVAISMCADEFKVSERAIFRAISMIENI